ncbi:hypothetical protein KEM55_004991 [Ascosphaera atra]|nr:hypothetical protein KEM55_004991 [Ascosphaera atra]
MFTRQSAAMCGRLLSRTAPLSSRAAGAAAFTTRASTPMARRFAAAPTPAPGRAQRLSQIRFASSTPENKDKSKESTSKLEATKKEPEPEEEEEEEEPPKKSRAPAVAFVIVGSLIFLISSYGSYQYVTYQRAVEESKKLNVPEDVSDRYDKNASTFDATVDWAEWASGINGHRRRLALMATGNVLEVSCGTGRNEPYYQYGEKIVTGPDGRPAALGVRTVTFLDQSAAMLEVARHRFERKHGEWMGRTRWLAQSAMEPVPLPTELFHFVLKEPGRLG